MSKYILSFALAFLLLSPTASTQEAGTIIGAIPFELTSHNNISIEAVQYHN